MDRKASQTTNFHDKKHSHKTDVQFGMKPPGIPMYVVRENHWLKTPHGAS
jgi:hypothetical protein